MSTTIVMPTQIESAIKSMCTDAMNQAVSVLSKQYGFNLDEATRFLSDSGITIQNSAPHSTKSESKRKSKPKSDKPKRAKTGYLLYADFMRPTIKAQMESELADDEKIKPQDIIKQIAASWKILNDDEKAKWQADAKANASSSDDDSEKSDVPDEPIHDSTHELASSVLSDTTSKDPEIDELFNDPKKEKKKKSEKKDKKKKSEDTP